MRVPGGDLNGRHVWGDHRPETRATADQDCRRAAPHHAGQDVLHRRDAAEQVEIQLGEDRVDGDLRGIDDRRPAQVGRVRRKRLLEHVDRPYLLLGGGQRRVQGGTVGDIGRDTSTRTPAPGRSSATAWSVVRCGRSAPRRTLGGEPPADSPTQLRACSDDRDRAQFTPRQLCSGSPRNLRKAWS